MKRVGDSYVETSWEEAISDIAARMRRIMDVHGPDAIGTYWGNPAGFSSSNAMLFIGWMDGVETHSRFFVGSVDQNNFHVVSEALYGSSLMTLVPHRPRKGTHRHRDSSGAGGPRPDRR